MRYLFIGAHCDDIELCCGATVARLISEGNEVTCIALSHVYGSLDLQEEFTSSMYLLNPHAFKFYEFETRNFNKSRQTILQLLVDYSKLKYDYIFTHSAEDFNQDHAVVGYESIRAFKKFNLITYTGDWNSRGKRENYFTTVQPDHIEQKLKALSCYESQHHRDYMHKDYIWANLFNCGVKCGVKYAESFEVINLIT